MGTSVSVQQPTLRVDPGSSVSTELRVRNTGTVVDQFSFQPLGDAAGWITVEPPVVRLFPETDAVVTVTIAPPRDSSSRPGVATWAVKAVPQEDPSGAAVGEGTVDVGTFVEVGAELQPVTGRGRFAGRFELAIDNRGNLAVPVRINGTDQEQSLGYEIDPPAIDSQPGSAHFAKLRIRPATKIWRGQPKNHPFQIVVEPQARVGVEAEGAPAAQPIAPIVVNGNLLQEPIIPKWLLKAILALLALILLLFVLWKTLLKPSVESAAREVAIEEVAPVSSAIAQLEPAISEAAQQAEQASEQAAAAQEAAAAGGGGDEAGGGGGALDNLFNSTTQPTNFRLVLDTAINTTNTAAAPPMPAGQSFALTDIILQNPAGDIGRLRIKINNVDIFDTAVENWRDLDFHFVAPYIVSEGQVISIEVVCAGAQIDARTACTSNAVSFSGFTTTTTPVAPPTTAPAGG